jgi:TetR/AcrR family transcriptional regulator
LGGAVVKNTFQSLDEKKQHAIINAGLWVFSRSDYKKASTDEIIKRANISKGSLFYHFENKKKFYLFLFEYSVNLFMERLAEAYDYAETDFFEMLRKSQMAKIGILVEYPDMTKFLVQAYQDKTTESQGEVFKKYQELIINAEKLVFEKVDVSKFRKTITLAEAWNIVLWMSEGFMNTLGPQECQELEAQNTRLLSYLEILRQHFYRTEYL